MTTRNALEEIAKMIGAAAELYSHTLSEPQLALYVQVLSDREPNAIKQAMVRYMRTPGSKWFPKPGELIELMDGNPEDRAGQAWLVLSEFIAFAGAFKSVVAEDSAWARAVTQVFGGWPEACDARNTMHDPMWQAKRKEFASAFRWHTQRQTPPAGPMLLDGYTARVNYDQRKSLRDRTPWHEYVATLSANFEMGERRVLISPETQRPTLALREVLSLPESRRVVMAPESRALLTEPGDATDGPAVERARGQFLALLERMAPRTM